MKAIIWREWIINYGTIVGILYKFIIPFLPLVFFGIMFNVNFQRILFNGVEIPYILFLMTGLVGFYTFSSFSHTLAFVRVDHRANLIEAILGSKTSMWEYFCGKFLRIAIEIVVISIVVFILSTRKIGGYSGITLSFSGVIFALFINIISCYNWFSLGFILGAYVLREDAKDLILGISTPVITLCSPVYYNIEKAPSLLKTFSEFNPLTYTVNAMRNILISNFIDVKSTFIILLLSIIVSIGIILCLKFRYREI